MKEGGCNYYTSIDLPLAERIARAFEAKYPGVKVRVERTGAERVFQRIGQEYGEQDPSRRRRQFLRRRASHRLEEPGHPGAVRARGCGQALPRRAQGRGRPFSGFRLTLCPIAYNTKLVKAEEAPKSFSRSARPEMGGQDDQGASVLLGHDPDRDLSDRPATSAGATSRSSPSRRSCRCSRPPIRRRRSCSASARSTADGTEYVMFQEKEEGRPVEIVYPAEGTPLIVGPNACSRRRPIRMPRGCCRPGCARRNASSSASTTAACARCMRWSRKSRAALPLAKIKLMKDDAAAVEKEAE